MATHSEAMKTPLYAMVCAYLEANGWERFYPEGYERWANYDLGYYKGAPRTLTEAIEIQAGREGGELGQTTRGFPALDCIERDGICNPGYHIPPGQTMADVLKRDEELEADGHRPAQTVCGANYEHLLGETKP